MYTHVFMLWLGVLLAVVVGLELLRRERLFPLAALLACLGFALTLGFINVDGSIVRQNVARARTGEALDVAYLASLSAGAVLACRSFTDPGQPDADWRAFTLTQFWSEAALKTVQPNLNRYNLQTSATPVTVTTPAGKTFKCADYYSSGD